MNPPVNKVALMISCISLSISCSSTMKLIRTDFLYPDIWPVDYRTSLLSETNSFNPLRVIIDQSRTAAISKVEHFVNLGCCNGPRSASDKLQAF